MRADDSGQISIIKTVLIIAAIVFIAADFARPMIGRAQLDEIAHDVAEASAEVFKQQRGQEKAADVARGKAEEIALEKKVLLVPDTWAVDEQGTVSVTVERTIEPWLLGKLVRGYFTFRATATERFTA